MVLSLAEGSNATLSSVLFKIGGKAAFPGTAIGWTMQPLATMPRWGLRRPQLRPLVLEPQRTHSASY